jgi:glucokinase
VAPPVRAAIDVGDPGTGDPRTTDPGITGTVAGIDVGGTLIKGAVVTSDGAAGEVYRVATNAQDGQAAVVAQIDDLLRLLTKDSTARTGAAPVAVGIAVPGVIDGEAGIAHFAANIGWKDLALRRQIQSVLDVPVAVSHDAAAAAMAEATLGAAVGVRDFLFLAIGTGIGGSLVLDGVPYIGAHGLAGELGHVPIDPQGEVCGCGERGCLETVASAASIGRRYAARRPHDRAASRLSASEVLKSAELGDPDAAVVRDDAVAALASALTTLQRMLDVDLVVIGGGLSAAASALLRPLAVALKTRARFGPPPRLEVSLLGSEAGCLGAAVLALRLLQRLRAGAVRVPDDGWHPAE